MKKVALFLILFLGVCSCYGISELKDVGISKYAVLEVLRDNAPLRTEDNEGAKRLTRLFKDTVLFADKQTDKYYRVELRQNLYGYVNKKDIEVQAIIPEKRFKGVKKLSISDDKRKYDIKIETEDFSPFITTETKTGLDFILFDNRFDASITNIDKSFLKYSFFRTPIQSSDELKISYNTKLPLFGYDVEKFDKGYIYSVKKPPKINKKKPLKGIVVVVDPGHGGVEKGACAFDLEEKKINLQISKKLKKELSKRGAKVYLTRSKDKRVDLYDRVGFAKEKEADILLSIHQNSLPNPKNYNLKHGTGTYYYHQQSKPLAAEIQKELVKATGFRDDKVNHASFALTRPTYQISVLVECGYIIHPEEAEKISDKKFQKLIAKAIARGVENYLSNNFLTETNPKSP